jgi:F-type H+-transporting ATPase subunit gamma
MASLKDIRRRIGSVKNTRQTTRAMKMVAAAKLRKSQEGIMNARPYANAIQNIVGKIASTQEIESPLFKKSDIIQREIAVVISSDRGLCGSFNSSISKFAFEYIQNNKSSREITVVAVGKKASDYLRRRGIPVEKTVLNLAKEISYQFALDFAEEVVKKYFDEKYDQVTVFYNEFKSAIQQIPRAQVLLPIQPMDQLWEEGNSQFSKDYIFEPNAGEIAEQLLRKSINIQIYKDLLESLASEHGARMNAMENATKNAGELIRKLTLSYNNARQAAITSELIEITSGAQALNN